MDMIWKRLIRIRLLSAVILALPGLFFCMWYTSSAVLALQKYERAVHEKAPGNVEFFHIHLYDILSRDVRWILSHGEPEKSKIETFVLEVGHNNMIELYGGAGKTADRPYVPAKLSINARRESFDIGIRLRGSRHWHYLSRKKSMKIKVMEGQPYKGHQIFNLINEATPLVVGQKIIADTASENGVMVPPYDFVRVVLNGEDLGVFHFQAQPDDTLFRKNRTMYSDFFSGNLVGKGDSMTMWKDISNWKKVTSRLHSNKEDVKRLEELLKNITDSSYQSFERYAKEHMDFNAFASFEAIDVVFGIEQHGFKENQKLYFDPYKGSWVPVAWDLRGFKHDGVINRVENPITIRLKMIPEYRALRDQKVWELLHGDASVNRIRKQAEKQIEKLTPELANDRLFSAYKQLPKVNEFAFKMLRPMSLNRLALVLESEMMSYERRHSFLMNQLQKNGFYYRLGAVEKLPAGTLSLNTYVNADDSHVPSEQKAKYAKEVTDTAEKSNAELQYSTPLHVIVAGETGVQLEKVHVSFADCTDASWQLRFENESIISRRTDRVAFFSSTQPLMAGVRLGERVKGDADLNRLKVEPVPTDYMYVLESTCVPLSVELFGVHSITQNQIRAQKVPPELWAAIPTRLPNKNDVPAFEQGTLSPHPSEHVSNEITPIALGPGKVQVTGTQVFGENTVVTIAAGTTFEMDKKSSMIFKGKVYMNGSEDQPIVFSGRNLKRWEGVALQGIRTAGSVLRNVMLEGGSYIKRQPVVYTSMLNIHNTRDILIEGCTVQNNRGDGDAFHAAYVKDLDIRDMHVENVTMDAVDIEFSSGRITRAWIRNVGDDGIDLMDSKIRVSDSVVLSCAQHGVSAGENSSLQITDFLVAWSQNGVFAKDSSMVDIGTGVLIYNPTGVKVGKPSGLYGGDVEIAANALYVMGAKKLVDRADRKKNKLDDGKILFGFVDERPLRHLFSDVLQIRSSSELGSWLNDRKVKK